MLLDNYQYNHIYNMKEHQNIVLSENQQELITGLMLGDGHLSAPSKYSKNSRLIINRSFLDQDYAFWIYDQIKNICVSPPKKYQNKRNGKITIGIRTSTMCLLSLSKLRQFWYPRKIKKIPQDLKLTAFILFIWFCDDGHFRVKGKNECCLTLSTHGFSKKEVNYLIKLLNNKFGGGFRITLDRCKYYIIEASTKPALKFVKEIDHYFNNIMIRKANRWRSEINHLFIGKWFELPEQNIFYNKNLCIIFYKYCLSHDYITIMQMEKDKIINHKTFKKISSWLFSNKLLLKKGNKLFISNAAKKYMQLTLIEMCQ